MPEQNKGTNESDVKRKIVDAATQLFLNEGYENVSMRKIAAKVGYSATNIYNYFENKQEVLEQLLKDGYALFLESLKEAKNAHNQQDVKEQLRAVLMAYVHFGITHPDYYHLLFIKNMEGPETIVFSESDKIRGFLLLHDLCRDAINQGFIKEKDALLVSQSLWAMIHGITSLLITFKSFPWVEQQKLIKHVIDSGLNGM